MKNEKFLPFFAYGTLLPGQPNDHYWSNSIEKCKPAVLNGAEMFSFQMFPMIIEVEDKSAQVMGKLIWVAEEQYGQVQAQIDYLENYDPAAHETNLYQRLTKSVQVDGQEAVLAWVYIGTRELVKGLPRVKSGDWVKYLTELHQMARNQK